jgi:hypothetical protein
MKVFSLILAFFCLLSSSVFMGCTDNQKSRQEAAITTTTTDSTIVKAPNAKILGRLAVIEYRYPNDKACTVAAKKYFTGTGEPMPLPGSPLVYSFCDSNAPTRPDALEIRFTVNAASPAQPVDTINYYEVERKTGNHKSDIEQAFRVLRRQYNCDSIKGPTEYTRSVNGVKPWRAIMKRNGPVPPFTKYPMLTKSDEFGLIINPPYPR